MLWDRLPPLVVLWGLTISAACEVGSKAPPEPEIPFEPVSAQAAVRKVKNVLVGLPPTDEEVAAVAADAKALDQLIQGWMQLPQYDEKLRTFFSLAFQQTQLDLKAFEFLVPPLGLSSFTASVLLQNITESFARTVIALDKEGHSFKDSFTTHRFMMTPALMQFLAFIDQRYSDNKGRLIDEWPAANPGHKIVVSLKSGPIPIEQTLNPNSSNFLHFYHPGLPLTKVPACQVDPIVIDVTNSLRITNMLSGRIGVYEVTDPSTGQKLSCSASKDELASLLTSSDFTNWKMVTIRPPNPGESPTVFFDLVKMRTATELVLKIPRVGFFTTPGFAANWPTNSSNQFRGIANQTMIVATGNQFDGNDPTASPQTPGLEIGHADDPACIGCHRLLDPTRAIFASTYSWNYGPASDAKLIAEKGLFNFLGVTQPVTTIDGFATVLASHPAVASGWTQKLCQYVRSAPCDPEDREYKQLVANFDQTGSWSTLVRDLMMSPMITNLKATTTYASSGEVIAVSRRDHLCAALDARLKLHDACGRTVDLSGKTGIATTPSIVAGLPSDGYGRGSTAANLPNDPTLFFSAGLENICANVAQLVIDAPPTPTQPDAMHWTSEQSDVALDDFTSLLVGIPKGDPDFAATRAVLAKHYVDAQQIATKANPLRSTFIAACMSPTFSLIGL